MTFFIAMALPFAECWMKEQETPERSKALDRMPLSGEEVVRQNTAQVQLVYG
jgi:hypothetical protein